MKRLLETIIRTKKQMMATYEYAHLKGVAICSFGKEGEVHILNMDELRKLADAAEKEVIIKKEETRKCKNEAYFFAEEIKFFCLTKETEVKEIAAPETSES